MVILTKKPKKRKRARVYVRAWRIHRNPRGGARDVVLSITAPSGGTPQGEPGASVSEHSARKAEEGCRRRPFFKKFFHVVELVHGVERWRSCGTATHEAALQLASSRRCLYTAQGFDVTDGRSSFTVRQRGVEVEIKIVREENREVA